MAVAYKACPLFRKVSLKLTRVALGHYVAQLQFIFCFEWEIEKLPVFAYVQPFKPCPGTMHWQDNGERHHVPDYFIEMFRVTRRILNKRRAGEVVPLTDIWMSVELVPVFGKRCKRHWTSRSAIEESAEFYLNCFSDKEVYQNVY